MGVSLNITLAKEHVPEIERRIHVVKERTQATRHTLPVTYIPKVMLVAMVANATTWINAFPAKGGVSATLSPRTLLTGERFDCNKHCCIAFGAYTQVLDEPIPSNIHFAWTSGAMFGLGLQSASQIPFHALYFWTHKITQRPWTGLPMHKEVSAPVDTIGKAQGQPTLLTFFNQKGQPIGDHKEYNKIPGVAPKTTGVKMDQEQEEFEEPIQLGLNNPHPQERGYLNQLECNKSRNP
jgi:hypothetical protein